MLTAGAGVYYREQCFFHVTYIHICVYLLLHTCLLTDSPLSSPLSGTTVLVAAVVKAGLFRDWEAAFEAIKVNRPVVRLNSKMRKALTTWQCEWQDGKKD